MLTIHEFRQLPEYFISQAERLCADLMYGFEPDFSLSKLKDEMTNTNPGYSFVTHPSNGLDNGFRQLLTHACAHSGSFSALSGHGRWNWFAVKQYLKVTKDLEEVFSGGLLTSCGQAPRLRELVSLECENSPTAMRGLYLRNGSVIYIIKHHKAKRTTNHEFNVVRFLPARLGVVAVTYLAYVRRVASILRRELDDHTRVPLLAQDTRLLFHTHGKIWPATRITAVLTAATRHLWKQGINSQRYRQVAIGITEKHVREVFTPFNKYDDYSNTADRNAVFAWQSGHRPTQRGTTYGLDGAFPHQLQPSLLRVYEWASTRWHEFICQASKVDSKPNDSRRPTNSQKATSIVAAPSILPDGSIQQEYQFSHGKVSEIHQPMQSHTVIKRSILHANTDTSPLCIGGVASILPVHKVIVCLHCKAGIMPGVGTESHFRHKHQLAGDKLKDVLKLSSRWQLLDPSTVPTPDDGSAPIPELLLRPGYKCSLCLFMTTNRGQISRHNRVEHKTAPQKPEAWEEVYLQTFMTQKYTRYWTVTLG